MASRTASARRYAEAVFELASETGSFDVWAKDLRTIADFASDPEVSGLLRPARHLAARQLQRIELEREGFETREIGLVRGSPVADWLARDEPGDHTRRRWKGARLSAARVWAPGSPLCSAPEKEALVLQTRAINRPS